MDTAQLVAMLAGAGAVIGTLATTIYKLMEKRIAALEAENASLRNEAKAAVVAKDREIELLREVAANLTAPEAKPVARRRTSP